MRLLFPMRRFQTLVIFPKIQKNRFHRTFRTTNTMQTPRHTPRIDLNKKYPATAASGRKIGPVLKKLVPVISWSKKTARHIPVVM